ncbi:MAG: hypothetical protein WBM02_10170 [bacterium]
MAVHQREINEFQIPIRRYRCNPALLPGVRRILYRGRCRIDVGGYDQEMGDA